MYIQEVFRWEKQYSVKIVQNGNTWNWKDKHKTYSSYWTIGITVKLIGDAHESQNRWRQKGTKSETYGKAVNEGFVKIRVVVGCSRYKQKDNTSSMCAEDNVHIFPKLHSWAKGSGWHWRQDKKRSQNWIGSYFPPAWELLVTDQARFLESFSRPKKVPGKLFPDQTSSFFSRQSKVSWEELEAVFFSTVPTRFWSPTSCHR